MMEKKKLSVSFRLLRALGFNYSEDEYGDVSVWNVIGKFFHNIRMKRSSKMMDCAILEPFAPRKIRPILMRKMGCHVGKGCFVGDNVRIDTGHADMITLEDGVSVAGGTRLLCHQRDFTNYFVGSDYMKLGYSVKPIVLKKRLSNWNGEFRLTGCYRRRRRYSGGWFTRGQGHTCLVGGNRPSC